MRVEMSGGYDALLLCMIIMPHEVQQASTEMLQLFKHQQFDSRVGLLFLRGNNWKNELNFQQNLVKI